MRKECFAAMDLGTNSCRILVANNNAEIVYRNSATVKLGEGLEEKGNLSEEAKERTLKCLFEYKQNMDKYNIVGVRAVATAAMRKAKDGEDFLKEIFNEARIKFEIIDADEEARLTLKGAKIHIKGKSKYAVVYDIGGGSTEITLAENDDNAKTINTISMPFGSMNSTEKFSLENYNKEGFDKLYAEIKPYTDKFVKESNLEKYIDDVKAVATSSSPLRLAALIKGFASYDRFKADGIVMTKEQMDAKISEVYDMSLEERCSNPCIGRNRGPLFISTCIIFKTIYDALNVKEITASLKAAQEAIIEELIQEWQIQHKK